MTITGPDPLVGRTIGQYQILARIGGGGMGVVYSARASRLGRVVALKFLPPQWSHDEGAKQRFVREAQAASATNHPNICTIHDIESADDGQLFIVMAYYEGETLKKRLESGPLPIEEALDIATQVSDGLAKAHAAGIVHRDIKPGNIIVTEDGVRILDFGLATFVDAMKLTAENAPLGTIAYMSPEQVRGLLADARSDVWATGAVLYEMLTGHPPFRGTHVEAIGHAVRNEPPAPIRAERGEVPEEVEQLVFRALHKEPDVRYQSGRELARAVRTVRGISIPIELRTTPVAIPPRAPQRLTRPRWRVAAVTVTALATIGAVVWWAWPRERVRVAVVPVVNLTGYSSLDPFTPALTQELQAELDEVASIRVFPHQRLLEVVRLFRQANRDASSPEAVQVIAAHSGARVLIVPAILRDGDAWKARLDFRDPATGVTERVETSSVASSLMKDAVYGLVPSLTTAVRDRFASGPSAFMLNVRRLFGRPSDLPHTRLRTLDAAAEFEKGIDAYERYELTVARDGFAAAAALDSSNPLPLAWQSRIATLLRRGAEAADTGMQALRLSREDMRQADRSFVEAVGAEARRDPATALARYDALIERDLEDPMWLVERAGLEDRLGRAKDAVTTYHAALALDDTLIRPRVELCRLYVPTRLNEPVLAQEQGERALAMYTALSNGSGQAQAHWCLADVLRAGTDLERQAAKRHADTALEIVQGLGSPYGMSRAYNYLASVAWAGGNGIEAVTQWDKTLALSRQVGNALLESRTLMNLGVAHELLGHRDLALKYYRQSFAMFEAAGSEQDAAQSEVNAAAIQIHFGGNPEEGFRDAQNALAVFEHLGDKDFEVFARLTIAAYYRNVGRRDEALRELTLAESLARHHDLDRKLTRVVMEMGQLRMDAGDYAGARDLFQRAVSEAPAANRVQPRIELARSEIGMGDYETARAELEMAARDVQAHDDTGSQPTLALAQGELAYETGSLGDARSAFARAVSMWTPELPAPTTVHARAYLGLLDALRGNPSGRTMIAESLAQARKMKRVGLEATCQIFLARVDVIQREFGSAVARLDAISPEIERGLAPELSAQRHYWRSQALKGRGDRPSASVEAQIAAKFVGEARSLLPPSHRDRVLSRPVFRLILGELAPAN